MVKYKSKLSAAAVFLVMCFTLVMSGYDSMTGVGATECNLHILICTYKNLEMIL